MSDPIFYDTVDTLYHAVMDTMPQFLQDRPMASAFGLGSSAQFGVVKFLQVISKSVVAYYSQWFEQEALPFLEKACTIGMFTAPILYAFIDPDGAKEIMTLHPTYTSGMLGVWSGSIIGAVQDIHYRAKYPLLEEILSEPPTPIILGF